MRAKTKGRMMQVRKIVGDSNLLISVRGQIRGSAFEERRGRLADRMMKDAPEF